MYQLRAPIEGSTIISIVVRLNDFGAIPFAPDNTDYQQFKKDIQNGVQLNDAEGNPITGSALTTFLATLP